MNDNCLIAEIEGYASIFGEPDLNGDRVAPGAFAASLKKPAPVRMLYQHDAAQPLGQWTEFREDRRGLFARGFLILSSMRARETFALLQGGALDGLSIGYQTIRSAKETGGRRILEASLWEVSIVTFPMAPNARVTRLGTPKPAHSAGAKAVVPSSCARPGQRASVSPQADARLFADALQSAATILSA